MNERHASVSQRRRAARKFETIKFEIISSQASREFYSRMLQNRVCLLLRGGTLALLRVVPCVMV